MDPFPPRPRRIEDLPIALILDDEQERRMIRMSDQPLPIKRDLDDFQSVYDRGDVEEQGNRGSGDRCPFCEAKGDEGILEGIYGVVDESGEEVDNLLGCETCGYLGEF